MITHGAVVKGATDQSCLVRVIDSTDGTPETGVAYNTAGVDLKYWRVGANTVTDITEVTQTANGAHTDGGFVHLNNGYCRLDLPDAAVASGADAVVVFGTFTGMIVIGAYIPLVAYGPQDGVRLGLTALPNAAAQASGGLFTRGTGAGQINQDANGRIDVNIAAISTDGTAADNLEAYCDGTTAQPVNATQISGDSTAADNLEAAFDDTAGPVPFLGIVDQGTAQSASGTGVVLRAAAAFADDVLIGNVIGVYGSTQGYWQFRLITGNALSGDSVTVDTWTVTPSGTITYKIFGSAPASVTAPSAVNIVAIGGDSVTAAAADNFNTFFDNGSTVSSVTVAAITSGGGLDAAGVRSALGMASANMDTQLSGIQSDTNDIQTRLPAALVSGRMAVDVIAVSGDTAAADALESYCDGTTPQPVNVTQVSGDATAADNLEAYCDGTTRQPVNVLQINSVTLQGAGVNGNEFRPV